MVQNVSRHAALYRICTKTQKAAARCGSLLRMNSLFPGSGPVNLIGIAELIGAKSREKPAGRVGIPHKGFDAGVRNDKLCAWDRQDFHGFLCRNILKDIDLSAVLLCMSAQIRETGRLCECVWTLGEVSFVGYSRKTV
jgi:hypothetical protein